MSLPPGPDDSASSADIEARLEHVGRYSRLVATGLSVILLAFALALFLVLPQNTDSLASAVEVMLQPLIFVGMGLLLFGIGMHLHLMHLNLVRQLRMDDDGEG